MENKTRLKRISGIVVFLFLLDVAYTIWWYIVYKIRSGSEMGALAYNEPHAGDNLMPRFMREELFLWVYLFDLVLVIFALVFWYRNRTPGCAPVLIFILFYTLKFSVLIIFIAKGFLTSGSWNY